jgi:HEAT repeat protein
MFIEFVRNLRDPVRSRRQEKIREVELTWSDRDLAAFRIFAVGLQPAEMADICYALADTTAIPLLDLLVDLAEINNELMQIALRSLAHTPLSAKLFLAKRLLSSKNVLLRSGACAMLADAGSAAFDQLAAALDDESHLVAAAAIRALAKLGRSEAGEKLLPKLRGGSEEMRSLALESMARLGTASDAFARAALEIYGNPNEKTALRGKAARVLAGMGNLAGRDAMLHTLAAPDREGELRRLSALELAAFPDRETVDLLLRTTIGDSAILAEAARQSLLAMPQEKIIPFLEEGLEARDEKVCIAAAEILGCGKSRAAFALLSGRLAGETRPAVLSALAGALGRSGFAGAWGAIRARLAGGGGDSLPLLAALADAATRDNLDELSLFLERATDNKAQELLLRRLAAFSHTLKPSPIVLRRALDVLNSGNPGLSIPAIEILAYSGEETLRDRVLSEMAYVGGELPTRRLLRVMLKFKKGDLAALFRGCGAVTARLLAPAAAEADRIGEGGAEFFSAVASWVRSGAEESREGLNAAAALDPDRLVEAMRDSPDRVCLLEAWASLPARDRLLHPPDLDSFFALSEPADRLRALEALFRLGEERHLGTVTMLALLDKDAGVRDEAGKLVRRLASEHHPEVQVELVS